ncbi:NEAT domain-containing protein [Pseudogracilibacillus sp. SO10305]|uniref:NEAT domain-containing protein n=1 Tax=Pseudogracilibacillus sp. SO10305 TaxID=3098292 RepID=UPI00300DD620
MRKPTIIFSIVLLLMSLFGQQPVLAETSSYNNIEPGSYDITAKALNADKDEASGAAGFIDENATLTITEDSFLFTITIPKNDMAEIAGLQVEGAEPVEIDGTEWTYQLNEIDDILNARTQYEVPKLNMKHDVPFRFKLEGLTTLPTVEETPEQPEQPEKPEQPEDTPEQPDEEPDQPEDTPEQPDGDSEKPEETPTPEQPDENNAIELENGLHSFDTAFINVKNGSPSAMARYLGEETYVEVKDGKTLFYILINDNETVTKLELDGKAPVEKGVDGKKTLLGFEVDALQTKMDGYAEYQAPLNGEIYNGNADFNIELNDESIKKVNQLPIETETTVEEDKPKPEEKPSKPEEKPEAEDKVQTIDYVIKHETEDKASAADEFFKKPGKIVEKNGKYFLEVTVKNWSMIDDLKANGKKINVLKENKKDDEAVVQIPIAKDFSKIVPLSMKVTVPGLYETTHEARLVMDIDSLKEVEEESGSNGNSGKDPNHPGTSPKDKGKKPSKQSTNQTNVGVNAYNIDYTIKHATKDEASTADGFFEKPGTLLEKNGKYYLQVTVTNWSMIDWIEVNGNSIAIVSENKAKDIAVIQFAVPSDLSKVVPLTMKITVPGLYETVHEARLVMNPDSMKLINGKHSFDVDENLENNIGTSNGKNRASTDDQMDKPAFGNATNNGTPTDNGTDNAPTNPKTGDTSKIILYSLLLVGSLAMLVLRIRKTQFNG